MKDCGATDTEPGREPDTLVCHMSWGHDGPHYDAQDGISWQVEIASVLAPP